MKVSLLGHDNQISPFASTGDYPGDCNLVPRGRDPFGQRRVSRGRYRGVRGKVIKV